MEFKIGDIVRKLDTNEEFTIISKLDSHEDYIGYNNSEPSEEIYGSIRHYYMNNDEGFRFDSIEFPEDKELKNYTFIINNTNSKLVSTKIVATKTARKIYKNNIVEDLGDTLRIKL